MMIHRPRYNRNARPRPEVIKGQQQSQDSDLNTSLLYLEQMPNLTHGLTPNRLRRILADADAGNIAEQHALFADMEDRCDHLAAEMGKRKRALLPPGMGCDPRLERRQGKGRGRQGPGICGHAAQR